MSKSLVFAILFMASLRLVSAHFNIFEMFGQQQQQQQQQQHQHKSGQAYADSVLCSQYLCPATLDCVPLPRDCPCPYVEDIKCLISDTVIGTENATVVCTRGQNGCVEVENLLKKRVQSKKK